MIDLKFDGVSKRYRVRHEAEDDMSLSPLRRRLRKLRRGKAEEFWAVRDVNFEVKRGEALGIIGHNGAGKSTILKLISNITAPTSGQIVINGRLSALIEVGSGFHPELTGRENVFLSGSILGMRRREIARKLDSIVDFAGVRQFIDMPVKRYSSGMYVRLGFAIAAHLDPDILLLDEVLAVGDANFQAKCMNRIKELEDAGTTIVFISHDLNAVERLCDRVILMEHGQVAASGSPSTVIESYKELAAMSDSAPAPAPDLLAERQWPDLNAAPGSDAARLRHVRVCRHDGRTASVVDVRDPVRLEMTFDVLEPGHVLVPNFHLYNRDGVCIFVVHDLDPAWRGRPRPVGRFVTSAWIPGNFLAEGALAVSAAVSSYGPLTVHFDERDAFGFKVVEDRAAAAADSARGDCSEVIPGVTRPVLKWTTKFVENVYEVEEPAVEEMRL